ncbi:AAA family ATPase [Rhodococcus sp. NPDC058521]|uniref:AAA family ATPase n=1 Tax=Rhodococcus sp. NPDC058521 TaxID=3346536 RepID=UPI0036519BAC
MRLHHLEVRSFGPFADAVSVDFDRLGADGLFLLHGQTGAGKTTVLDAVAFALYGTVPGARREGKRLLSDHAPAGSVPRVELEATIGGRRLRLTRSPEYERPKKRGSGSLVENAKATLTWLDRDGENLSRIPDIADEIGRLMGMSADQFFQVVLLPQGEFAKFLRADNEERGQLLERLFDTEKFGTVEDWFVARRKKSRHDLDQAEREVDILVARIGTASGLEAGADADPVTWAVKLRDQLSETRDTLADSLYRAKEEAAATHEALTQARRLVDLHARRDRALAALARNEERKADIEGASAELDAARRAKPVAALNDELVSVRESEAGALQQARQTEADLRTVVGSEALLAEIGWPPADYEREVLRTQVREWGDDLVRLDAALVEVKTLEDLNERIETFRVRRDASASAAERVVTELEHVPAALQAAEADLDAARRAQDSLAALEDTHRRARDAADAAIELRTRRAELTAAKKDAVVAETGHLDAREHLLDLRERRIAGMAAELAQRLVKGEECQVCGSTDHPRPAEATDRSVTKADEDRAVKAEQAAAGALVKAKDAVATVERAIVLLEQRGGDEDVDELSSAAAAAESELSHTSDLAGQLDTRANALRAIRESESALHTRSRELNSEVATLTEKLASAITEAEKLRTRIEAAAGDDGDVLTRSRRVKSLVERASELADARDAAVAATAEAAKQLAKTESTAREAGFDSIADALAAVRDDHRQAALDTLLAEARDVESGARAVLAEPDVEAISDSAPPALDTVRAAHAEKSDVVDAAVAAASEAERRLQDVERHTAQLMKATAKVTPQREAHEELAALAELIAGRGQNARKMSLRSYVLAARLEEVALSASVRLRRMSGGRYEFVHSDEAGPRGKRGGLGLDIRDDYTGTVRSAKTLSGGESFLASLSLALGLADVVAAESGGVVLDTMFIDEGFGTLDADTLDSVMSVLDELRDGGRVVGIVSHVDEMRQRIPSRLHVIRGRFGSTLEVVAG